MNFFKGTWKLLLKSIRWMTVVSIIILLWPVILFKSLLAICTILFSSSSYEQKALKSNAIYEAVGMPIYVVKEIYQLGMNKKVVNHTVEKSKFEKIIVKGLTYIVGLVLFIGPLLNMCTSGYYALNREGVMQKNMQLGNEIEKVKEDVSLYGKVYHSKTIILSDYDSKIAKREAFIFEYQMGSRKTEELCIEIMKKNDFEITNELNNEDDTKVLLFKKNEYIGEIHFLNDKEAEITVRRYDWFRESKWYDILSPIMLLTSPWNPFRRFGF